MELAKGPISAPHQNLSEAPKALVQEWPNAVYLGGSSQRMEILCSVLSLRLITDW